MKTSELTRSALDWAVAQANGDTDLDWFVYEGEFYFGAGPLDPAPVAFMPSRNWFDGGPIIERERIAVDGTAILGQWMAVLYVADEEAWEMLGPTPLIAAMRCYVASKLGHEIELPEGL